MSLGSIAGAVGATAVYPIDLGMRFYCVDKNRIDLFSILS
jgi:hypothetical protein